LGNRHAQWRIGIKFMEKNLEKIWNLGMSPMHANRPSEQTFPKLIPWISSSSRLKNLIFLTGSPRSVMYPVYLHSTVLINTFIVCGRSLAVRASAIFDNLLMEVTVRLSIDNQNFWLLNEAENAGDKVKPKWNRLNIKVAYDLVSYTIVLYTIILIKQFSGGLNTIAKWWKTDWSLYMKVIA
jgi:hypothetical protein